MLSVIISFCTWTLYYFGISATKRNLSPEWVSRIVAMTHALVITKCIEYCMLTGPWPFSNMGENNTACQNFVLSISAGYFIFETFWCFYMQTEGIMMLLHHTISVLALLGSLYTQVSGAEVTLTTWGSELTNPFLQIRWYLRELKLYSTTFAYINDFVFVTLFFIVRVCFGSVVAFCLSCSTKVRLIIQFFGYSFFVISLLWMYQIFKFAKRRFLRS